MSERTPYFLLDVELEYIKDDTTIYFRASVDVTNSAVIVRLLCGNSAVRAEKVRAKNKNVINLKKITASLTDAVIKMTYIVK